MLKFFAVPALEPGEAEREVNAFLAKHRIVKMDRQLVSDAMGTYWALSVTYLEPDGPLPNPAKRKRVDYREVLPPGEFEAFAHLRRIRKELAERDGVPPYQVFNNEQLATIVRQRVGSLEKLGRIAGVGPARVKKYGQAILDAFREVSSNLQRGESPDAADDDTAR